MIVGNRVERFWSGSYAWIGSCKKTMGTSHYGPIAYGLISMVCAACWFWKLLAITDSFASNYALVAILSIVGAVGRWHGGAECRRDRIVLSGVAFLYSASVCLANHTPLGYGRWFILLFVLGCVVAWNAAVLLFGVFRMLRLQASNKVLRGDFKDPRWLLIPFFTLCAWYMLVFFAFAYPGHISEDSVSQLTQVVGGSYSNHHPYWHTVLIGFWYGIGKATGGTPNAGVAAYSCFQMVVMAAVFAFCVYTLWQAKVRKAFVIGAFAVFCFAPYHVAYSFTMWKDVLFGLAVLLLLVSVARILFSIGTHGWVNYALLIIGAIGTAVLRNNGWLALLAFAVMAAIAFRMRYALMLALIAAVLGLGFVMTNPVLSWLGVAQTESVESLSIPLQQIARAVVDNPNMDEEDREAIDRIMPIDQILDAYTPWLSNPIKWLVRQDYVMQNTAEFVTLWMRLGVKYPVSYANA